jgi:hypothetical protein
MPPTFRSPYRLLVEGSDDQYSVIHLMARHGYDWDAPSSHRPFVHNTGSLSLLLSELPVTLKDQRLQRIGALVDADTSAPNRWSQIREYAKRAEISLPISPQTEGLIVEGFQPGSRIGFWLMPDNSSPGNLESFLRKLVPEEDRTWAWAEEVVHEARQRGARCKPVDHLKSALHTWLAWQEEPGLPFGTALRAQVFRHDSEDALRFVAWFNRLFVDA